MRYQINNGALNELSDIPINPLSEEIDNFDNGVMWHEDNNGFLYNYLKINNTNILLNKVLLPYLIFSSDSSFTLGVPNPGWLRLIEYSLDKGNTWLIWDGSLLSGDEDNPIYLRGMANEVITGSESNKWLFTGKYITGNIEALLNCQAVANGQHPAMGDHCYAYMFDGCSSLIIAPKLPAITLVDYCYFNMFRNCTSLITAPGLPATTLADYCYMRMFQGCTSLTTIPQLPAATLASYCYFWIFYGCTSLKLSTTQDSNVYKYPYRIPTSGIGTDASNALSNMFTNTGGTFTNTPVINTTYYTDHQPV